MQFLIRNGSKVFQSWPDGDFSKWTTFPSRGLHFDDFESADAICQMLADNGFPDALVCDVSGMPVTFEMLRQE